jgi:pyruvate formate lyase activating enzyme
VLETLEYIRHETDVWLELTTLLIPGENDSVEEIDAMTSWVVDRLGPDVPMHFTAFHPEWKMLDKPRTPPAILSRARTIARENGVRYAYTGNVVDGEGGSTWCPRCGALLIERHWHTLGRWNLTADGACRNCETVIAGRFEALPGAGLPRPVRVRFS